MLSDEKRLQERAEVLSSLSDEALYQKFWELADKLARPLIEFSQIHTTPSIERSVLMRMGFNSVQAKNFVDRCVKEGIIGKGAGGVLFNYARQNNMDLFSAFDTLMSLGNWKTVVCEKDVS